MYCKNTPPEPHKFLTDVNFFSGISYTAETFFKTHMKELKTDIQINAPVETVWNILIDFEKYPDWNPFVKSVTGDVKAGQSFKVVLQPEDSRPMTFKPVCLELTENRSFRWLGHFFIPGLFDGEHIFELTEQDDDTTHFIQREKFNGLLVPFLWKMLDTNTRTGFEKMNQKLKELAEGTPAFN